MIDISQGFSMWGTRGKWTKPITNGQFGVSCLPSRVTALYLSFFAFVPSWNRLRVSLRLESAQRICTSDVSFITSICYIWEYVSQTRHSCSSHHSREISFAKGIRRQLSLVKDVGNMYVRQHPPPWQWDCFLRFVDNFAEITAEPPFPEWQAKTNEHYCPER